MKNQKKYPNNGPSMEAQMMMMSPRKNKKALVQYFKNNKQIVREETLSILNLE